MSKNSKIVVVLILAGLASVLFLLIIKFSGSQSQISFDKTLKIQLSGEEKEELLWGLSQDVSMVNQNSSGEYYWLAGVASKLTQKDSNLWLRVQMPNGAAEVLLAPIDGQVPVALGSIEIGDSEIYVMTEGTTYRFIHTDILEQELRAVLGRPILIRLAFDTNEVIQNERYAFLSQACSNVSWNESCVNYVNQLQQNYQSTKEEINAILGRTEEKTIQLYAAIDSLYIP
jgi:hypothetical protein